MCYIPWGRMYTGFVTHESENFFQAYLEVERNISLPAQMRFVPVLEKSVSLRACLLGGRVTLVSENFTGKVTLQPGTTFL